MLNKAGGGGGLITGGDKFRAGATRPEAFGKLGYTWGQGEVVSLCSLPDYKCDPEEHFDDVCVTGADGANRASSAAVAHASGSVSNAKKQSCSVCLGGSRTHFSRLLNRAGGGTKYGGGHIMGGGGLAG